MLKQKNFLQDEVCRDDEVTAWTWRAERSVQDFISLVCFTDPLAPGSQKGAFKWVRAPK